MKGITVLRMNDYPYGGSPSVWKWLLEPAVVFPASSSVGYCLSSLKHLFDQMKLFFPSDISDEVISHNIFGESAVSRNWVISGPDPSYYGKNKPPYPNAEKAFAAVSRYLGDHLGKPVTNSKEIVVPPDSNRIFIGTGASNPDTNYLNTELRKRFRLPIIDYGKEKSFASI